MTLEIEVRSSGPGPRAIERGGMPEAFAHIVPTITGLYCAEMGERWTRHEVDHRGRLEWLSDGVAIIIRRAP